MSTIVPKEETMVGLQDNCITPKISVVIPVYNVEGFLRGCLDSIVNQTLADFEVICVNDGSTDNSLAILNEYANKDSRFKIISQENQGQGVARNNAIDIAVGKYLFFVDPDDFIEADTLDTIYKKFQEYDVDLVQFDYATCKENGKYSGLNSFKSRMCKCFKYSIKNDEIYSWHEIKKKNLENMSMCVWDKAYKMELIKSNHIKFAQNKHGEDHIFSISANLLAGKILYVNKAFYHYRTRIGSAVNKASDDNFCVFDNIELLKKFLVENNLFEEYKKVFNEYIISFLSWHYALISAGSKDKYLNKCRKLLNSRDYGVFFKKTKGNLSLMEKIFSIKNQKINGVKVKYLTVLGVKLKLQSQNIGVPNV